MSPRGRGAALRETRGTSPSASVIDDLGATRSVKRSSLSLVNEVTTVVPSAEFQRYLSQPGTWVGLTLGALALFGLAALFALSWIVPGNLGMWGGEPPGGGVVLLCLILAAAWLGLGGLLLRSVALGVLDARSGTLEVLSLVIEEARPARHVGQHIYYQDASGARACGVIPSAWALGALPKRVELWRSSHSKTALRLRIEGEPVEYSVLSGC